MSGFVAYSPIPSDEVMEKEADMDILTVFSELIIINNHGRGDPLWDDDMRALYAARLAEMPPPRPVAVRLAAKLEGLAAWLRRTVDEPGGGPWHIVSARSR
jgi:hypothetical protein